MSSNKSKPTPLELDNITVVTKPKRKVNRYPMPECCLTVVTGPKMFKRPFSYGRSDRLLSSSRPERFKLW